MGMGNPPTLRKIYSSSLMPCPMTVDENTLIMGLLLGILETCYSSSTLTVP